MPVRSLNSSVLKWPDGATVRASLERWTQEMISSKPGVIRLGYIGSYARDEWGVGNNDPAL